MGTPVVPMHSIISSQVCVGCMLVSMFGRELCRQQLKGLGGLLEGAWLETTACV